MGDLMEIDLVGVDFVYLKPVKGTQTPNNL